MNNYIMNFSNTNEILKNIKTNTATLSDIDTNITDTNSRISGLDNTMSLVETETIDMNSTLSSINTKTNTTNTSLNDIDITLDTINSKLVDIGVTLDAKKICFQERLTYNGNNYLNRQDYTSSNVTGEYQNTSNKKQYITAFHFTYEDNADEPSGAEMYHSTAFTTKIGRMANDVFTAPYITLYSNHDQVNNCQKNSGLNDEMYDWETRIFDNAPIELGITEKFGHLIAGDFSIADYGSNPVGYIQGYSHA